MEDWPARWALALQPFQFKVQHRAATANGNADGLSCQYEKIEHAPSHTLESREEEEYVRELPLPP